MLVTLRPFPPCCSKLRIHFVPRSLISITTLRKTMVTSRSSGTTISPGDAYTTISDTVTVHREIKKSKFIAIAGRVSDEPSANSFLSQVFPFCFFYYSFLDFYDSNRLGFFLFFECFLNVLMLNQSLSLPSFLTHVEVSQKFIGRNH